jgi:hypothetical protein
MLNDANGDDPKLSEMARSQAQKMINWHRHKMPDI